VFAFTGLLLPRVPFVKKKIDQKKNDLATPSLVLQVDFIDKMGHRMAWQELRDENCRGWARTRDPSGLSSF
jgi:hypothetical protein